MMELQPLVILASLVPLMFGVRKVIESLVKKKTKYDVYVLSDDDGHKVSIVLRKLATAEERAEVINKKAVELTRQQTA